MNFKIGYNQLIEIRNFKGLFYTLNTRDNTSKGKNLYNNSNKLI